MSFVSIKFKHPSRGTNAAIFFPDLIICTLTTFLIAELGCFASTPLKLVSDKVDHHFQMSLLNRHHFTYAFAKTMAVACGAVFPISAFQYPGLARLLLAESARRLIFRCLNSLPPQYNPSIWGDFFIILKAKYFKYFY
ncbi:hypothetical protein TCON_0422 [Astathelohania contejeani]|uniref:Uncharacterized protein n=1 Tax=Astathelohania contejeani TaxID=164912 RepID=A0ABQ7I1L1_9MICR|nr:hypothetical protein TCON_0422 [Thelohania contejeani]